MLQELSKKDYQNFYINQEGIICGIVTPKEIWMIKQPKELLEVLNNKLDRLKAMGNFQINQQEKVSKMIAKLQREIKKVVA